MEPGRTGFLESEDQVLADRCAQIIRDAGLRAELSRNTLEKADIVLDLESYQNELRKVYEE